jgi:hypothetical protein
MIRFVNSVVSCAASTHSLSCQHRTGNTKDQILHAIERLKLQYKRINYIFRAYPEIGSAFDNVTGLLFEKNVPKSFDTLRHLPSIQVLTEVIFKHIDIDLQMDGEAGRFLGFQPRSSKPKLNCVDRAAFICQRGPKIITTPGSQFSFIFGIFFEIATKRKNESMQGAIISLVRGDRPELYWFEDSNGENEENSITKEMDDWATEYESRRARIMAEVTRQFRDDLSLHADLLERTIVQIKNAEACIEDAKRRANFRRLGEPVEN